jgi:hypothetical protein
VHTNEAARIAEDAERKRLEVEQIAQAETLEKAGASSLADAVISRPIEVEAITVAPEVATVAGVSARIAYHAEVFDTLALARYAGQCPEKGLVLPNMPMLNSLAREQKDAFAIPGVRAIAETVRTVRG